MELDLLLRELGDHTCFQVEDYRRGMGNLERMKWVCHEFISQIGLSHKVEMSDVQKCMAWHIEPYAEDSELQFSLNSEAVLLHSDYTDLYILPYGRIFIDQVEQSKHWHSGNGGYFATEPLTAIGRFLGQGFKLLEMDGVCADAMATSRWYNAQRVSVYADGSIAVIDTNGKWYQLCKPSN